MPRVDSVRSQLGMLIRRFPFQPFSVNLENGDQIIVEHPENISFDSSQNGVDDVHIISKHLVHYTSLSAITSVAKLDTGAATA